MACPTRQSRDARHQDAGPHPDSHRLSDQCRAGLTPDTDVAKRLLCCKAVGRAVAGHAQILVRDRANRGWIDYMLKGTQKSQVDEFLDCLIIESLRNPIADA
jgi:hypothetical protein